MELVSLLEFKGFDWDEGTANKNRESHKVSPHETEQVFFNRPLIVADDVKHSRAERRYYALGQTDDDRALFVASRLQGYLVMVISAREMSRRENPPTSMLPQRYIGDERHTEVKERKRGTRALGREGLDRVR
jgi:hypothetical protein